MWLLLVASKENLLRRSLAIYIARCQSCLPVQGRTPGNLSGNFASRLILVSSNGWTSLRQAGKVWMQIVVVKFGSSLKYITIKISRNIYQKYFYLEKFGYSKCIGCDMKNRSLSGFVVLHLDGSSLPWMRRRRHHWSRWHPSWCPRKRRCHQAWRRPSGDCCHSSAWKNASIRCPCGE